MRYAALNGDLVHSRARGIEATKRLEKALEAANRRYRAALAAPFTLSKGDAFQGLLKTPGRLPEALLEARLKTEGLSDPGRGPRPCPGPRPKPRPAHRRGLLPGRGRARRSPQAPGPGRRTLG